MAQANATISAPVTPAGASPADAVPDGRRREPRTAVDRPIVIIPCNGRDGMRLQPGRLVDCSPHGLGVLLSSPLPLGGQFMVKSRLREFVLLLYTVRNCRRWRGGYRVGAEFTGIIGSAGASGTPAAVSALLG